MPFILLRFNIIGAVAYEKISATHILSLLIRFVAPAARLAEFT